MLDALMSEFMHLIHNVSLLWDSVFNLNSAEWLCRTIIISVVYGLL